MVGVGGVGVGVLVLVPVAVSVAVSVAALLCCARRWPPRRVVGFAVWPCAAS